MTAPEGRVEAVYIAEESTAETEPVQRVTAVARRGLEGDRHFDKRARKGGAAGKDLTLIEAEAIEGLVEDTGIELGIGKARRNVVTRGVRLDDLIGRRFTVGGVECLGVEPNDPCKHLESLTQPGVLRGLVGRGGLRADIVVGGEIAVGDRVHALED